MCIRDSVMRDADPLGDIAGVMDVLAGAAGALAMGGRPMVVQLQRDADNVVTLGFQQRSRHRGIDAAGHGDDDPCVPWTAFEIETVEHGSSHCCDRGFNASRSESHFAISKPVCDWKATLSLGALGAVPGNAGLPDRKRLKSCSLI